MRIIIAGLLAFVIWCVFSAWMFNDNLLPVLKKQAVVPVPADNEAKVADSLARLKASLPESLLVYFPSGKSEIKADPQLESRIAPFRAWLHDYPDSKLLITGHTDLIGTHEYNMQLGLERAQAVTERILKLGIERNRIITESKGETRPAAGYISEENRAKNRRTEITIKLP
ncbi:MAG: OmpA family protein [Bacteroidales bacterium]|nr:OmpA family protein [Bacteroidales bacterium]